MREFDHRDVKLVHMLGRRQGMDPAAFQQAWLDLDLGLIASLPGLRRYGQNHALLRGYARGNLLFDGFEEYWFEDAAALDAARSSLAWQSLEAARATFADPERGLAATVNISVQKQGTPPVGAIRSTEFVNRRPDMSMGDFRAYWLEKHGPLAQHIPQILLYEQNHLDDREYGAAAPRFDGWAATWFLSTAEMRASAQEPVYRDTRLDEPNFLAGPLPVLFTRERLTLLNP